LTAVLLACRVFHIAATCTSLGGLFYARLVLWPTLPELPSPQRDLFLRAAIRRFAYIKWSGVMVVAVTGIIQWAVTWPHVTDRNLYVIYFSMKMVAAVGLFTITALLALPSRGLEGMRQRRAFWSGLNVLCGLMILVGAALMRTVVKVNP
jgi:uncharacterized membrane protein